MCSRPFLIRSLLQGGEGPVHLMPQGYGCPKERNPADDSDLFLKSQREERREEQAFFKKSITDEAIAPVVGTILFALTMSAYRCSIQFVTHSRWLTNQCQFV